MDKHYGWIVNNWVHDVGTGMWAAALLVIWRLSFWRFTETGSPSGLVLARVSHEMFWIMLASLVVIAITGGFRLRYWRNQNTADELPYKKRSLLVKHALYLAIYGTGTVWAWFLVR